MDIRCSKCRKKLAEVTLSSLEYPHAVQGISIKCSRCGHINSLNAFEHPEQAGKPPARSDIKRVI